MIPLLLSAAAFNPMATCGGTPTHWGQQPSVWHISDSGNNVAYSGISNADLEAANQAAWDVWSDATSGSQCSSWQHANGGLTSSSYGSSDSTNVVAFTENSWDASLGSVNGTIAVTMIWWGGGCEIYAADQIFNGVGFSFSVGGSPGGGQTDLQSIMAHENGHWLGLDHTYVSNSATMYPSYSGGTGFRSLEADDAAGAVDLYPGPCGPSEDVCDDGLDNDSDGQVDCADSDCTGYPECVCAAEAVVGCNSSISGSNAGGSNTVQEWGCANWSTTGPEAVYTFTPLASGPVTVTASGLSADLDMFVGAALGGRCDPSSCQSSGSPDTETETVSFDGVAGQTYTVVLDGWEGATSGFTLSTACPEPPESEQGGQPDGSGDPTGPEDPIGPTGPADPAEVSVETDLPYEGPRDLQGCSCSGTPGLGWTALPLVLLFFRRRT